MSRATLALCVIARDEERFIADCLDSARPFVQELVVVDTGSTDRTVDIARQMGARVKHFAWCDDFAAARNAAIEYASSDWILMLDADERLDPASGPALRRLVRAWPSGIDAVCPLIENRRLDETPISTTAGVPRIFPRRAEIRFLGAIHEVVKRVDGARPTRVVAESRVKILHYGYDPALFSERGKDARNALLLERGLQRDPADARLLFFQVQQHVVGGRYAAAVATFERFELVWDQLPVAFRVESFASVLTAALRLDLRGWVDDVAKRHAGLLGAKALQLLSDSSAGQGDLDRAIAYQVALLGLDLPAGLESVDVPRAERRLRVAELYAHAGDAHRALEALESAYADLPLERQHAVALQAARFAVQHADVPAARRWVARAEGTAAALAARAA